MSYASEFLGLPGLRGYWAGAINDSGAWIDLSANGRNLTYNGNPTYNYTTQGAGYIALDGTGDYLNRTSEAGLNIAGNESYVASAAQGLTIGGYFYVTTLGTLVAFTGKWNSNGVNERAYMIYKNASDNPLFSVSSNGTTATTATASGTVSGSTWYFLAGRFTPSAAVDVFIGTTKTSNTTSIPSSIYSSSADYVTGAYSNGALGLLTGRASNVFVCAAALSDTLLSNLYNNTKAAYGL